MSGKAIGTQRTIPPGTIDLGLGHPDPALLPLGLVADSAQACFRGGDASCLQYGAEQGSTVFREVLAGFLNRCDRFPDGALSYRSDRLFVSTGVSHTLDLICTLFTRPGDVVAVEEPTYFLALKVFRDHRLKIVPIPTDADGLDVAALGESCGSGPPRLLYTIPVHQNPSGITLAAARREELIVQCAEWGTLIVADEVYRLLTYEGTIPPSFGAATDCADILALGSFSKILGPGLRTGWVTGTAALIDRIVESGVLDSGGGVAPFTSALLTAAVADGALDDHLASLRGHYRERRDTLVSALDEGGARRLGVSYRIPAGGYFLWLRLPDGVDVEELSRHAAAAGVRFLPGTRASVSGGLGEWIRLCFAYYPPEQLREGARRILAAITVAAG